MSRYYTDDVNGQIVGGDYGRAWVTYCGRNQGAMCYPKNETQAKAMCEEIKSNINQECGQAFDLIYPKSDGWLFHFDGIWNSGKQNKVDIMKITSMRKAEIAHIKEEIYRASRFKDGELVATFTGMRGECQKVIWEWEAQHAKWNEEDELYYYLKLQAVYGL
jgi:hypothetical protein